MITIGREICCALDDALQREWLTTNGIGGYASATLPGTNTRRYHGLLVAALNPPLGRTVMLSRVDEELIVDDRTFYLATNEYHDRTIYPNGYLRLEEMRDEAGVQVFRFAVPDAVLTKMVWMEQGQNTTYVRYELDEQSAPVTLRAVVFTTYRGFHTETHGAADWHFKLDEQPSGWEITAYPGAEPLRLRGNADATFMSTGLWYWRYLHRRELERGLDCLDDLYSPGLFIAYLEPGQAFTIQASAEQFEQMPTDLDAALERRHTRQRGLLAGLDWAKDDPLYSSLITAADQFIVQGRGNKGEAEQTTTIAGYHWFSDWTRDTLIALPGLTLATGRYDEARAILRTLARYVNNGMLPNRFPDDASTPEYNTVDGTLWFFQALRLYLDATGDLATIAELYPALEQIFDWHWRGTRFGIQVDDTDGLLRAGSPGMQLTWMDAKVGDWVVTPRHGKPVEVNALWHNALRLMEDFSTRLGKSSSHYRQAADRARQSFNNRYWHEDGGFLYDVVDGEEGNDASLRPNQLFAIGLYYPTLDPSRWDAVLTKVEETLVTPRGIRSLAPGSTSYRGHYGGDPAARDASYHNGPVWTWLLGPFADAAQRVGRDPTKLQTMLDTFRDHLDEAGIGTVGEIFDGDAPHHAGGCVSQAWSVAEILRVGHALATNQSNRGEGVRPVHVKR